MKRVNVHLEESLDAELAREAARSGESKAALLRRAAGALLDQRRQDAGGGWDAFTGAVQATEVSSSVHDDDDIYR